MADQVPAATLSKAALVLALLADGPATTAEIAAELGWDAGNTGDHVHNLYQRGKVKREPFPTGDKLRRFLWSLA